MESLGARLRRERVRRGWTLQVIAERMRVVPIYVSDIERAKRRPVKEAVLRAIAEAYELPYAEVEELALTSRDEVQLRTAGQDDARKQVAVKLARAWTDMPDEKIEDLRRILDS